MFILNYFYSSNDLERNLTDFARESGKSSLVRSVQEYKSKLNNLNSALNDFATHMDDFEGSPILALLPLSFVQEHCQKITSALSSLIAAKNDLAFKLEMNRLRDKVEAEVNERLVKTFEFLARLTQLYKAPTYYLFQSWVGPGLKKMLAQKGPIEEVSKEIPRYDQTISEWGNIHKNNPELVSQVIALKNLLQIHLSKDKPLPWVTKHW